MGSNACASLMNPVQNTNVPPGHIMQKIATAKGHPLPKQDYKHMCIYMHNV